MTAGCYTIFQHPAQRDLGTSPDDPRAVEMGYYPYSPTVWGWYYGHYGDYWSYYAQPWWYNHHPTGYYPDEDGFSPLPERTGFGRGGRGGSDTSGWSHPQSTVTPAPPRQETTTTTTSGGGGQSEGPEKPKDETDDKPSVGGRGGRR
jgi:hypothetical protein